MFSAASTRQLPRASLLSQPAEHLALPPLTACPVEPPVMKDVLYNQDRGYFLFFPFSVIPKVVIFDVHIYYL